MYIILEMHGNVISEALCYKNWYFLSIIQVLKVFNHVVYFIYKPQILTNDFLGPPPFPGEMFAVPLPLYPHYPDRYLYPAVLVTLRPPAPGLFRESIGFLPSPPVAPSYPLQTHESQVRFKGMSDLHCLPHKCLEMLCS